MHTMLVSPAPVSRGWRDVEGLRTRERRQVASGVVAIAMLSALEIALSILLSNPLLGALLTGALILLPALCIWLWKAPARGLYVLFSAAVLLPMYYRKDLNDPISKYVPYFPDISSWTSIRLVVSINEIFVVLVLSIWLLKSIAERDLHFTRGSLFLPFALYIGMVLVGAFHGLTSGGDFRTALWEMRGQIYMFVAYIMTCNLVKTRSQVWTLLWTLIIAAGVRGIEGSIRYIVLVRGKGAQELYSHEQSFFFNLFLTLAIILFLYGGTRRMKRVTLALLPFVIYANLANNRRAAVAAFVISLFALLIVTLVTQRSLRRAMVWTLLVLAVLGPPYYVMFEGQSGIFALPARAIASNFHPDPRDATSNQYRANEDADIMATMKTNPIIGYGYGKPMLLPYPLPNIANVYVWWNIMPHNSILWIWMRLGTIGFALLWLLIGSAMVQAVSIMRRLEDRRLQGLALFVLLAIMQQVVIAYVDLQWSNWRCLITTGILFALISCLPRLEIDENAARHNDAGADSLSEHAPQPWPSWPAVEPVFIPPKTPLRT